MTILKIELSLLLFLLCLNGKGQEFSNPTLEQWTINEAKYDAPRNGNPIIPGYYADPTIIEDRGTFYIYATSDLTSWDAINKLGVWSSSDLENWTCTYLNWPTKDQCSSETGRPDGVWAPSVVKAKNGRFYMYVTIGREIWVGVADDPLGPWQNARADEQPLIRHKEHYYVETIDAECFIDDDGQAYLYWGSADTGFNIEGRCLAVKLNEDMTSFDDAPRDVTPPHFFEAPYVLKRDSIYYLMYSWGKTWDKTYQVRYATGKTPFGPWVEGLVRPILVGNEKNDRITSTGHHTVLRYRDKYYIVYHRFNTLDNYDIAGNLRQIAVDELEFGPAGDIKHVLTTHMGSLPVSGRSRINLAYGTKSMSSSDLDTLTRAGFANDENNGTLWVGQGSTESDWLAIDLGKPVAIQQIEISVEYPIYPYAYKLAVSDDGENWVTIDDRMDNTTVGSPMRLEQQLTTRFIRVTMANSERGPRPGIWELKVF